MVSVPVTPGRLVQVQDEPQNKFRYAESRNFVGRAVEQAGGALANAAQDWDAINAVYDTAAVKKLDVEVTNAAREALWTGDDAFFNRQGMDAHDARPGVEQKFTELREQALSRVTNERQRNMLTASLDKRLGDYMVDVSRYSVGQLNTELQKQAEARLSGFQQDAVRLYNDPERYADNIAGGLAEINSLADQQGWAEARIDDAEQKFVSGVHSSVITGRLTADDVDGAMALFDKYRDDMAYADIQAVETKLQPAVQYRLAENDALAALAVVPASDGEWTESSFAEPLGGRGKTVSGGEYGAARSYGGHSGQDYAADPGTPVNPTAGGIVRFAGTKGGYGNRVEIDHGGGYVTTYSHLDGIKVSVGQTVDGSTVLGGVGNTGASKGNHLHYEMMKDEKKYKPEAGGNAPGGQSAARKWDLSVAYSTLESQAKKEGWTPERLERARQRVDERVKRDEMLNGRREDEEWESALGETNRLGDGFTDVSQIPNYDRLPETRKAQLRNMADAGKRAALTGQGVSANGDLATALEVMAIEKPEEFLQVDLREYRGRITPGEFSSLQTKAATIRAKPQQEIAFRGAITGTITAFATPEMNLTGERNAKRKMRVQNIMETYLRGHVKEGVQPTQAQLLEAMRFATGNVKGTDTPRAELPALQLPPDILVAIIRAYRAETGRSPTDAQILSIYQKGNYK